MTEKNPSGSNKSTESLSEDERIELEMLTWFLETHPQKSGDEEESSHQEKSEKIDELERMFSDFEIKFPLDELLAITTEVEARESTLREGAKEALIPLHTLFKEIELRPDITSEEMDELKKRRKAISMAVGFINSERLRHE